MFSGGREAVEVVGFSKDISKGRGDKVLEGRI